MVPQGVDPSRSIQRFAFDSDSRFPFYSSYPSCILSVLAEYMYYPFGLILWADYDQTYSHIERTVHFCVLYVSDLSYESKYFGGLWHFVEFCAESSLSDHSFQLQEGSSTRDMGEAVDLHLFDYFLHAFYEASFMLQELPSKASV